MWLQFFWENIHFALNVIEAMVMFAITWLYLDAYSVARRRQELFKTAGFAALSLSFFVHALYLETTVISISVITNNLLNVLQGAAYFIGMTLVILGLLQDPIEPKPSKRKKAVTSRILLPLIPIQAVWLRILTPVLTALAGLLYIRRATVGLEHHLKIVGLAFYLIAISQLISLIHLWTNSPNVDIARIAAPFGPVWLVRHILMLVAIIILYRWVYSYLFKRLFTQLFFIFQVFILCVFLTTSVAFSTLLVKNVQDSIFAQLERDAGVLAVAIESKKAELLANAQLLAQHPQVPKELSAVSKQTLKELADALLLTKQVATLEIVNFEGTVVVRAHDPDRIGDSLADDPLVKRATAGSTSTSLVAKDGLLAKEIILKSSAPIKSEGVIVGAVITGAAIDNAFVDNITKITGLTTSVFADNVLSATSLTGTYENTRPIGTFETNPKVIADVLQKGVAYTGGVNILSVPYFASYRPLTDADNVTVGMLRVAVPQLFVLQLAARSIEVTFMVTTMLLILSLIPAALIARYLSGQLTKSV